jgi:uncharacterized membrane protein YadS
MEISIGTYSLPVILTVVLGIVYKLFPVIGDSYKALVAVFIGALLGVVAMLYGAELVTAKIVIEYIIAGFMAGAAAVGLYEAQKAIRKPRE